MYFNSLVSELSKDAPQHSDFLETIDTGRCGVIGKNRMGAVPNEIIGIPKPYWAWGGLGAVLLGILFS